MGLLRLRVRAQDATKFEQVRVQKRWMHVAHAGHAQSEPPAAVPTSVKGMNWVLWYCRRSTYFILVVAAYGPIRLYNCVLGERPENMSALHGGLGVG